MKYTEFDLVDFANYVLNNRRMSSQNGDVGYNEFMNWLESRKPQEFIRRIREYKLSLLWDNPEDIEGYNNLTNFPFGPVSKSSNTNFKTSSTQTNFVNLYLGTGYRSL